MPARLAPDALRPTALPLPAPCAARSLRPGPRATFLGLLGPGPAAGLLGAGRTPERPDLAERRSGSAAAAACRPACGTAGPAAASLAPSLLLPAPSAVLGAPHALAPPQLSPRAASASSASTCACSPTGWRTTRGGPRPWAPCCLPACGIRPMGLPAAVGQCRGAVPARLDFMCLQDVFHLRAERRLLSRLAPNLVPVSTTWHIRPAARATPEAAGQRAAAGLALPAATRRFPVLPHARREDALASKGLLSAQVPAHRPRRSGTRKGAGHGVERAKVPKRSWASRTGAASWAFLHCTHLHSPRGEPDWLLVGSWAGRPPPSLCAEPQSLSAPPLPPPFIHCPRRRQSLRVLVGSQIGTGRGGGRRGRSWVSRRQNGTSD